MPPRTRKKTTVQAGPDGRPPAETIRKAIDELGIDRPYYACRLIGNRLEFSLYGGDTVTWPPKRTQRSSRGASGRGDSACTCAHTAQGGNPC